MTYPYLEPFLDMLISEKGCGLQTQEAYKQDLLKWFHFMHPLTFKDITPTHHYDYVHHLSEKALGARSIARHLSSLRQFFYFLVTEGVLAKDPWQGLRAPRYTMRLPRVMGVAEIHCLLTKARLDLSPEGIRLWTILELLYATGMRVSELLTLPLIPITGGVVPSFLIRGKGGHERFVFLTPQALEALEAYKSIHHFFSQKSPFLFPSHGAKGHLTRQRVGQLLKELALSCGLGGYEISPHAIRHAFATHLLHRGVDLVALKQLLGHRDISTTQLYTHVDAERWINVLTMYHPLAALD